MITFKQFLSEGGAATSDFKPGRATAADIEAALAFVTKHTGIPGDQLKANLLGSTGHVLAGKKKDSGDIDIAIEKTRYSKEEVAKMVEKMKAATGMDKVHLTGGNVYSFAVPIKGKRVQVDLMFVPSEKWAQFGYHSHPDSKYKGAVRNLIIASLMKKLFEPGKDIEIKDKDGNSVVRVRRGFKMDGGLERLFRVGKLVKGKTGNRIDLKPATPDEVEAKMKELGRTDKFSKDADAIMDPDQAAEFMFGKGIKAKDVLSAEQVIKHISKRKDAKEIFADATKSLHNAGLPVPNELNA